MAHVQLEFFRSPKECEEEAIRHRLAKAESTLDKVRKGTYAALGKQAKTLSEIKEDLEIIKRGICQGNLYR